MLLVFVLFVVGLGDLFDVGFLCIGEVEFGECFVYVVMVVVVVIVEVVVVVVIVGGCVGCIGECYC